MRKQVETAGFVRFMAAPSVSVMEEWGSQIEDDLKSMHHMFGRRLWPKALAVSAQESQPWP